ncbi:hypothetical protein G7046_g9717 [Stylonectria norvegica]|nr:hypothetical protein G7046_g9717 [Stylonectria norvegica]
MGFLGVYRALYDYAPQAAGELGITDGDLLYVLDKNDDDGWWKVKKKAGADDEDEPIGLVPNNYVEEAKSLGHARALYEYTRQTDEELSFPDDAQLDVYDISDPDWILVGLESEYGFVPANYIDMEAADDDGAAPSTPPAPVLPTRPPQPETRQPDSPVEAAPPRTDPAAALAGVMGGMRNRAVSQPESPPPQPARHPAPYRETQESDDEPVRSPRLPTRPRPSMQSEPVYEDPPYSPVESSLADNPRSPDNFHMYNINEMVSVMGKKKKMPTTLGINLRTGIIMVAPERTSDGPSQEWTADRMTHYSREGKHVFMELVRPSKSVDFHAGAKDTAAEIVSALGELAGAVRAAGLQEVILAGSGQGSSKKKGHILYDFMAQGEDEVTVAIGDEVMIIDDSKSEEWWQVRRLKNGKEGVVPSSYIEITGTITPPAPRGNPARTIVEQNRLDEMRLTKEAIRASKEPQQVGPGMPLPERGSSLMASDNGNNSGQQRTRRENGRGEGQAKSKSKPDSSKVRTWTDRSKSFSVDAQFLGLKDGKIHLHKMNGVKIAVPITKMSRQDLEYVEEFTGISLEDDKPLADVKRARDTEKRNSLAAAAAGVTIDKPKKPEYDWFQFFLSCEVAVGLCERYAQAFVKDSMDESVLPDVDATILRALGLREGDIIKVMRAIDTKYGRNRGGKRNVGFASDSGADGDGGSGGLFSGPGGTLRNNTRKGRPAPAVQTSDVVDANAFSKSDPSAAGDDDSKSPTPSSPDTNTPSAAPETRRAAATGGFDDDAWDVKPSKQQPRPASRPTAPTPEPTTPAPPPAPPVAPALTGSMQELSLLTAPLQPTKTEPAPPMTTFDAPTEQPLSASTPAQQLPGATPSFFSTVSQSQPPAQIAALGGHISPQSVLRQRPAPPQMAPNQGSVVPPPPQRPLSAPLSAQPSGFAPPPMMPQMTGSLQGQVAPPGQSLHEINQARLQQQYNAQMQQQQQQQQPLQQLQPAMTGYNPQMQGIMSYPTGAQGQQFMQPMMTGLPQTQFSQLQAQPTGFGSPFQPTQSPFGQPSIACSPKPPAWAPASTAAPPCRSR